MRSFLESILGTYTPNTVDVNGVLTPLNGAAGVDWTYVITGLVFVVVLYCVLKALGGLINK